MSSNEAKGIDPTPAAQESESRVEKVLSDANIITQRFERYVGLTKPLPSAEEKVLALAEALISAYMDLVGGAMMSRYLDPAEKKSLIGSIEQAKVQFQDLVDKGTTVAPGAKDLEKRKIDQYCDNAIRMIETPPEVNEYQRKFRDFKGIEDSKQRCLTFPISRTVSRGKHNVS